MSEHEHTQGPGEQPAPTDADTPPREDGLQPARTNLRALLIFLTVVVCLTALAVFVIFTARSNMQDEVGQDDVAFDFAPEGRRLADRPIDREPPEVPQGDTPGRVTQAPATDSRRARLEEAMRQIEEMRRLNAEEEAAARARQEAEQARQEREAARKAYENRRRAGAVAYSSAQRSASDADGRRRPEPPDVSEMIAQIAKIGDATVARGGQPGQPQQGPSFGLGDQLGAVGNSVEVVEASWRGDQSTRLTQGTIIPGVLETAISSEGPGAVRAVVAQDIYSTDGARLLVPRGSRLFGEHASNVQRGGERVGIIWTRLQRPDGVDAMIRSPGTDAIGIAGIDGLVKRHFWQRFGGALLFSLLDVAGNRTDNQDASVLVDDGSRVSEEIIRQTVDIPPTVLVPQGKQINVLLARDIDFSGVLQEGYSYQ